MLQPPRHRLTIHHLHQSPLTSHPNNQLIMHQNKITNLWTSLLMDHLKQSLLTRSLNHPRNQFMILPSKHISLPASQNINHQSTILHHHLNRSLLTTLQNKLTMHLSQLIIHLSQLTIHPSLHITHLNKLTMQPRSHNMVHHPNLNMVHPRNLHMKHPRNNLHHLSNTISQNLPATIHLSHQHTRLPKLRSPNMMFPKSLHMSHPRNNLNTKLHRSLLMMHPRNKFTALNKPATLPLNQPTNLNQLTSLQINHNTILHHQKLKHHISSMLAIHQFTSINSLKYKLLNKQLQFTMHLPNLHIMHPSKYILKQRSHLMKPLNQLTRHLKRNLCTMPQRNPCTKLLQRSQSISLLLHLPSQHTIHPSLPTTHPRNKSIRHLNLLIIHQNSQLMLHQNNLLTIHQNQLTTHLRNQSQPSQLMELQNQNHKRPLTVLLRSQVTNLFQVTQLLRSLNTSLPKRLQAMNHPRSKLISHPLSQLMMFLSHLLAISPSLSHLLHLISLSPNLLLLLTSLSLKLLQHLPNQLTSLQLLKNKLIKTMLQSMCLHPKASISHQSSSIKEWLLQSMSMKNPQVGTVL